MSDYPGYDAPYTYGGSGTSGTRGSGGASAQPTTRSNKRSKSPWEIYQEKLAADQLARDQALVTQQQPMIDDYKLMVAEKKAAEAAADVQARYGFGGAAAEKQWLANNPAMNITLGGNRLDAMTALERRRALMEKFGNVMWDLPTNQGWQQGVTGPYGIVSGVGLEGDPLQDLPIWKQIAYLPSSEPIRKVLGVYTGPSGYAGGGGGGGAGGGAASEMKGRRGGGGGYTEGNSGYPKQGQYKQADYLPRWANSLVAWRTR